MACIFDFALRYEPAENASGLILASSPTFKKVLERQMSAELMICRLMSTRASFYYNAKRKVVDDA